MGTTLTKSVTKGCNKLNKNLSTSSQVAKATLDGSDAAKIDDGIKCPSVQQSGAALHQAAICSKTQRCIVDSFANGPGNSTLDVGPF